MEPTDGQVPAKVAETLGDDEVHVWRLAYDRHQGREPLRAVLAAYLDCPPHAVQLTQSEYGRPALAAEHGGTLDFNWTHSGDQALIALARGIAPGIDLERLRPRPHALDIARRFFHAEEAANLIGLDPAQRDAAFLRLWTAKEAVVKALGRGLAYGLHRLSIALLPQGLVLRVLDGDDPARWQLHELALDEAHVAALAWRGGARTVRCWTLAGDGRSAHC
nr:4'-phosphopantetheinyl transferase superfamily protein [Frateuria defendens]